MTVSATPSNLGRNIFGVAVVACGIVTLVARSGPLSYALGAAECVGGIAVLFPRTAKAGAIAVGAAYLVLSLLVVPAIIAKPQVYATWGNFFYPFSLVIGAGVIVARFSPTLEPKTVARTASMLLGVCVASFGIEQVEFLARTASLVPKWIPPSQMFWAIATCLPFALAAVALIANQFALLATRLLTVMFLLFVLLVWVPILISAPHDYGSWDECTQTFAIAGVSWILADCLASLSTVAAGSAI